MARYVKISCIGPRPLIIEADVPPQEAVDRMIGHWQAQLDRVLPDRPDLIVLPEACDRPDPGRYPYEKRMAYYQVRGRQVRDFFAQVARKHRCYITYATHTQAEDGSWRNSMQLIDREGGVAGVYHKNHLVPSEHDKFNIKYGKDISLIECDFGSVATAICFDLNFDELRLKVAQLKPDVIVFPSMYHGGIMQNYWAYSCRSYFAGAVAGLPCTILTPQGEIAASSTNYYPFITTVVNLDYELLHIDENGVHFRKIKQKYGPDVKIHDPGLLGSVLLTSESAHITAKEIVEEFGLLRLDDYFCQSLAHRHAPGHIEL